MSWSGGTALACRSAALPENQPEQTCAADAALMAESATLAGLPPGAWNMLRESQGPAAPRCAACESRGRGLHHRQIFRPLRVRGRLRFASGSAPVCFTRASLPFPFQALPDPLPGGLRQGPR